jgi:hypothetical protein
MDAQQRKQFYLKEIAPALSDLMGKCNEAGISFLAAIEWDRDVRECTFNRTAETSDQFNIAITAIECNRTYAGVDSFLLEMMLLLQRKPGLSSYEISPKDRHEG